MNEQIEQIGNSHIKIPERKTDPIEVWINEQYASEVVDTFRALLPNGDQHSGHAAFIATIKADLEVFSQVRDDTYNHDQMMEMRALVKYLASLIGRAERVVEMAKPVDEIPETTKAGPRVY